MKYLVLLLLTSGCISDMIPTDPRHPSTTEPIEGQEDAIRIVQAKIALNTKMDPYIPVTIHWVYEDMCGKGKPSIFFGAGKCAAGLHYSCDSIYVAVRDSLHASALAHELLHCYLKANGLASDNEHQLTPLWLLVMEANHEMDRWGL